MDGFIGQQQVGFQSPFPSQIAFFIKDLVEPIWLGTDCVTELGEFCFKNLEGLVPKISDGSRFPAGRIDDELILTGESQQMSSSRQIDILCLSGYSHPSYPRGWQPSYNPSICVGPNPVGF